MVTRADGKRCTKQRLVGGYCRQHEKLLGGDKGHGAILKSIPVWVPSAVRGWFSAVVSLQQQEDAQFAEACRCSLSGDAGRQDRVRRSREILDGRLVPRGLQRVPTAALGDCLFVAVAQTAGLEITHRSLRAQACDYMDRYREIFARFLDVTTGPFQSFSQYLDWMRVEQHWGVHLVLTAISQRERERMGTPSSPKDSCCQCAILQRLLRLWGPLLSLVAGVPFTKGTCAL